ncbi:MAG TPA: hypothetical protein VI259_11365 [Gemmatimonadaceae bacterium]
MLAKHAARLALVVQAAVPVAALAQSEPFPCAHPASFDASFGLNQSDRADAAINGTQYQGRGPQLSVGATANAHGVCVEAFATGGARYLRPVGGGFGSERILDGRAELSVLKPVASSSDNRATLAVGLGAQVGATNTRHAFGDASGVTNYRLGIGSVGPAFDASYRAMGGRLFAGASIPLVSIIDHPYVAVSSLDPMPGLRVASWSSLRGGSGQLGYERSLSRYLTGTLTYRVNGIRYDDARPVRTLSQMLTFGFRLSRPTEGR